MVARPVPLAHHLVEVGPVELPGTPPCWDTSLSVPGPLRGPPLAGVAQC